MFRSLFYAVLANTLLAFMHLQNHHSYCNNTVHPHPCWLLVLSTPSNIPSQCHLIRSITCNSFFFLESLLTTVDQYISLISAPPSGTHPLSLKKHVFFSLVFFSVHMHVSSDHVDYCNHVWQVPSAYFFMLPLYKKVFIFIFCAHCILVCIIC